MHSATDVMNLLQIEIAEAVLVALELANHGAPFFPEPFLLSNHTLSTVPGVTGDLMSSLHVRDARCTALHIEEPVGGFGSNADP